MKSERKFNIEVRYFGGDIDASPSSELVLRMSHTERFYLATRIMRIGLSIPTPINPSEHKVFINK